MILHVLGDDGPGGTQAVTVGHARALARDGHRQLVVVHAAPSGHRGTLDALAAADVPVLHLPVKGRGLGFALRFAVLCRRRRVGVVLTHGLGFHLVVAVAARLGGSRRTVVLVGNPVDTDPARRRRVRRRTRLAEPLVHRAIACSDHVAEDLLRLGLPAASVAVVANPLDVATVASRAADARAARVTGGPAVIGTVARLDPIKDHATVLRAIAALRRSGRDVVLRLAGTGPTEPALRRLASELGLADVVTFLGAMEDVPRFLGGIDVFAHGMTRDEGYGVAVAEAMAAGVPVVCTDDGPAREILADGRAGILVAPGDAEAMAVAIARLLDDPALRAAVVTGAADVCGRRHDPEALAAGLRRLVASA